MKKKNIKLNCSLIALLSFSYISFSQDLSLNETFKWNYDVNADAEVLYNNYNCDTKIITTEGNTVQYELTVNAEAKKQEDLDVLKNYLQNMDYSGTISRIELSSRFYKSKIEKFSKTQITLLNDEKINVNSFKYSAVLKIPATVYLNLQSKYSDITIGNIQRLTIKSHDDNIYGENVGSESDLAIDAKYSKINFKEIGSAKINLHDCVLRFEKTNDLKISTKYSECDVVKSDNVTIESHDDKFDFNETGNIKMNAKYTDFKSKVSGDVRLALHDSNIDIAQAKNISIDDTKYSDYDFENIIELKIASSHDDSYSINNYNSNAKIISIGESKYSDYKIENLQGVKITNCHDDNYSIKNLNTLEVTNTKYSEYKIGKLNTNFSIQDGHDDHVNIEEITPGFDNYYQNGKYGKIKINLNSKVDFIFNCSGKYLKIDSHVNGLKINIDKTQNSIRKVEGIKGVQRENMPLIKVEGYDMDLKIY